MRKLYSKISVAVVLTLLVGLFNLPFYGRELTEDEKNAFIVRDEWTTWVNAFTASLSELDRQATAKIYDNMDFYDMQYRFTEKYKKTPEYLDADGKPTDTLKQLIKDKRKELNRSRGSSSGGGSSSYDMINWAIVSTDGSNWMENIPDSRYIYEVNLPGTHDSGTFYPYNGTAAIDAFVAAAKCQTMTIEEQLDAGIRVLDLRLDESLNICHGSGTYKFTGYEDSAHTSVLTLNKVLTTVRDFLTTNPTEVVVVCVKVEDGTTANVVSALNTELANWTSSMYTGTTYPKISDVKGKMVLMSRISTLNKGIYYNVADKVDRGTRVIDGVTVLMDDQYDIGATAKTTAVNNALAALESYYINLTGGKGTRSGFVFTSSNTFSASTILSYESPQAIANTINPVLNSHTYQQGRAYGFIMMDFPTQAVIDKIYMTNP